MNPPDGLSAAGLAAWGRANRALEGHPDTDMLVEAAARYAYAADLAAGSREKWFAEGMPLTVLWPNGIESAHPLLKVIRDAEHDAAKFAMLGSVAKAVAFSRFVSNNPASLRLLLEQSPGTEDNCGDDEDGVRRGFRRHPRVALRRGCDLASRAPQARGAARRRAVAAGGFATALARDASRRVVDPRSSGWSRPIPEGLGPPLRSRRVRNRRDPPRGQRPLPPCHAPDVRARWRSGRAPDRPCLPTGRTGATSASMELTSPISFQAGSRTVVSACETPTSSGGQVDVGGNAAHRRLR